MGRNHARRAGSRLRPKSKTNVRLCAYGQSTVGLYVSASGAEPGDADKVPQSRRIGPQGREVEIELDSTLGTIPAGPLPPLEQAFVRTSNLICGDYAESVPASRTNHFFALSNAFEGMSLHANRRSSGRLAVRSPAKGVASAERYVDVLWRELPVFRTGPQSRRTQRSTPKPRRETS